MSLNYSLCLAARFVSHHVHVATFASLELSNSAASQTASRAYMQLIVRRLLPAVYLIVPEQIYYFLFQAGRHSPRCIMVQKT